MSGFNPGHADATHLCVLGCVLGVKHDAHINGWEGIKTRLV